MLCKGNIDGDSLIKVYNPKNSSVYTLVRSGDVLISNSFETVNKNLKSFGYTLTYSGSKIIQVVYNIGAGKTITKDLSYTGNKLDTITLSGDTPSGIELIKTLSYTGNNLTGVVYS